MEFFLKPDFPKAPFSITHKEKILLVGSCFTSNVGGQLEDLRFRVMHNPTGILFDPYSVTRHLRFALHQTRPEEKDWVRHDEVWHNFHFHTGFSTLHKSESVERVNRAIQETGVFLKKADILFVTLGSAYYYRLRETGEAIANCHRFPSAMFTKHLAETSDMEDEFVSLISEIRNVNPGLKVVFTVSPVRHSREGVVNNNRSKARLLEAVHSIVERMSDVFYFPAYEIVIDILRDYRFYDVDMVHPNYQATRYVFEQFKNVFFTEETLALCSRIQEVVTAYRHKPNFAETEAHRKFMAIHLEKIIRLEKEVPQADWQALKEYFEGK
jgi:hypothetical protein